MKKPSMISTAEPLEVIPYAVRFTVFNPTNNDANFKLTYSQDNGASWKDPTNGIITVESNSNKTATINLPITAPIMFRINQTSGSDKQNCYLDDIKLFYKDTWPPEPLTGDVNGDGEVNIADINAIIDMILAGSPSTDKLLAADVNGDGEVNIADVNAIIDLIVNSSN